MGLLKRSMETWYEEDAESVKRERRVAYVVVVGIITFFVVVSFGVFFLGSLNSYQEIIFDNKSDTSFYTTITKDALLAHLQELENIASAHSNSRSVNNGFNASLAYVHSQLNQTDLSVTVQPFSISEMVYTSVTLQQTAPATQEYVNGRDFQVAENSPAGSATGNVYATMGDGCDATQFADMPAGAIALVQGSDVCEDSQRATNAVGAGAIGLLIQEELRRAGPYGGEVPLGSTTIPIIGLSYLIGNDLTSSADPVVAMVVEGAIEVTWTSNLLAETPGGDPASVIVVGSHLDSVPAGPGINDNGSGSAVNLEVALQMAKQKLTFPNKIRFAWWGAEELGLLGSKYYVSQLSKEEMATIQVNLNYDMLASGNFFRGVYNGSEAIPEIRAGCVKVMNVYQDFWDMRGLPFTLASFNGRSDFASFLDVNITAGGLKTGSNSIKSAEERTLYGGYANAAHDTCYHQACDTLENVNVEMLVQNGQAAAYALQTLASQQNLKSYLTGQ